MNQLATIDWTAGKDLDAYIARISRIPILTEEEEHDLALRLYHQEDVTAAHQLVLSHLRFVVHLTRNYKGYGLPLGDLIQEGNIGLMKAIKRFNPYVGVRLSYFAAHWIKAEIHEFILRNWRIVKIATTKAQRKLFFNLRSSKKRLGWLDREESKQIAEHLGVSIEDVTEMEARMSNSDSSFDPLSADDTEFNNSPSQYLADPNAKGVEQLIDQDFYQHRVNQLGNALEILDERSRTIIKERWLDEDNKSTLQDLAKVYNVSIERIRQLEKKALKKLEQHILAQETA